MGRKSTKANKSIYQLTRESLDLTREKAGELIPGFSPERIEKIENGRIQVQPEDVMLMAEYYREPSLCNYYCANECPIGQVHALRTESKELGQIAVETLNALNKMSRSKERLLAMGWSFPDSRANFIFAKPPKRNAREIFEKLKERGIYVRYFSAPETAEYLRITVGTDREMDELFKNLEEIEQNA